MPAIYDQIMVNGLARYRRDRRFIKESQVPDAIKEVVTLDNMVDENGLVIVSSKNDDAKKVTAEEEAKLKKEEEKEDESDKTDTQEKSDDEESDDSTPEVKDDEEEETKPTAKSVRKEQTKSVKNVPKFVSKVPQTHIGMGFPRRNGKTVDIFDGVTPHTQLKLVGGHMVPLSQESFDSRSEKEIEDKLVELGFELRDFTNRESDRGSDQLSDDLDGDGLTDDSL